MLIPDRKSAPNVSPGVIESLIRRRRCRRSTAARPACASVSGAIESGSMLAAAPPAESSTSAAILRLTRASAIGPYSKWWTTVPAADGACTRGHQVAGGGTFVGAAVEMQQHQPAGRFAEVVDAGDRLLAAVAAFVQVYRAELLGPPIQPASCGMVRSSVSASISGRNATTRSVVRPTAGHLRAGIGDPFPPVREQGFRDQEVDDGQRVSVPPGRAPSGGMRRQKPSGSSS